MKLSQSKHIVKLGSSLHRSEADRVAKLGLKGLDLTPVNHRDYPQGDLAAHLLGFVGWDASGRSGVEQSLDEILRSAQIDSSPFLARGDGQPLPHNGSLKPIISSSFGQQVALTIDSKIQYRVEKILEEGVKKFDAKRGTALIILPRSGEILAWANYPTYNPNNFSSFPTENMVNWAANHVYEPGSTFKILTVASALELKAIDPDFRYLDRGKIEVGRRVIRNHHYRPNESKEIDLVELFKASSNTGASTIGLKMKPENFYTQLKKFGIGRRTGVEIPGESDGMLRHFSTWREIDRATTSFGQGAVAVTPVQLAAAINVIANDGEWVQPHLIKAFLSADGEKVLDESEYERRRVLEAETAKIVKDMLGRSVSEKLSTEPGYVAGRIPGYTVAGKTGTAQKYCPNLGRYCPHDTIASFIGFFPVRQPSFLVLVVMDSPQKAGGWGNTVSGPIFNQIGSALVQTYPNGIEEEKSLFF